VLRNGAHEVGITSNRNSSKYFGEYEPVCVQIARQAPQAELARNRQIKINKEMRISYI